VLVPEPVTEDAGPAGAGGPGYLPSGCTAGPSINPARFWVSGDYLLWKFSSTHLPSLASTAPVGLLAVNTTALQTTDVTLPAIPSPNTTVGFAPVMIQSNPDGVGSLDLGEHSGGRVTAGFYLSEEGDFGLDTSFFFLDRRSTTFTSTTGNSVNQFLIQSGFTQNTFLITPAMGSVPQTQTLINSLPLFFVRQATATLVGTTSNALWGAEINTSCGRCYFGGLALSGLIGFRYVDFHEDMDLSNSVRLFRPAGLPATMGDLEGSLPADLSFNTRDLMNTHNHFYVAQVGTTLDLMLGNFFLNARGKFGFGVVHESVDIDSRTTSTLQPTSVPGGLLAGPLDLGKHARDHVAFIPELNVRLGYELTRWLRAYVGYDGLFLSNVARPGEQTGVNQVNTQITVAGSTTQVNVMQPAFRFSDSHLYAQGIDFGLEFRY
jgi:hypothetical protein